ncbi:type VII secretion protein EssC [Butyrivibrio sp. DSM 10294]|uniref:type VII secretion protein EssC n=1 Tax=Butyrivibrio sp. DSM 10294 TaxID=2972457 RepID=UPI00234E9730|nr:type VII secretion protein EssC [Butyrivibrio sp. DSM 10294]MDC7292487.1 type VII secretion protein EssC [Butyrivibrio sp. DSM 10294]
MGTVLTIYSQNAFKRFLLPAINDADHTVLISENLFSISTDIELKMEIRDNKWYFRRSEKYDLECLDPTVDCYRNPLQNDTNSKKNEFKLLVEGAHIITVIANNVEDYFASYNHYYVPCEGQTITIGRNENTTLSYDYMNTCQVSAIHAAIFVNNGDVILSDNESANGTFLNNRRLIGSDRLAFGDCIDIFGLRIVFLGNKFAINVFESGVKVDERILVPAKDDDIPLLRVNKKRLFTVFNRAPRRLSQIDSEPVKIDEPPQPKDEVRKTGILGALGNALVMALPMMVGCTFMVVASKLSGVNRGIFMYMGMVTATTSATIGAIRGISGMKRARKEYEEYEKKRNEKYGEYLKDKEELIKSKYVRNTEILRDRYVPAQTAAMFGANNPLLWSRNMSQPDFLSHRLGIGDMPFQVQIDVPDEKFTMSENNLTLIPTNLKQTYTTLKDVPICVDLLEEKLIGVIGGRTMAGGVQVVRNLITQIAANDSYTDVKIALVYNEKKTSLSKEWDFVKWLPHVWNESKKFRFIASNKETVSEVFFELNKVIRQRIENQGTPGQDEGDIPKPYYVVIVAAPEFLEGELLTQYLLSPKPEYGFSTIYMVENYEQLPNSCEYIIENDSVFTGVYRTSEDLEMGTVINFDQLSPQEAHDFAERIACVEVQEMETGGDVPNSITFFEMYGIKKLDDLDVITRWKKNRTYESMKALVGQKAGGAPCYLDIHEKYHGPHGLVAGTTGSGKSETLQTYILSLAINYSPDDVSFFIIDYKGGGMANLFEELPHMIGQISNLSGNQIQRALLSIQSEKDRREALFATYGVKDIRDYTKLYKNNEATVPLPHLIIVIDEFAEMKKEEPEFIQEIVSVSRVGRSLGIHLIMATQKPAGSVSDDIWANSRFKLCLRVQSRQDSMDMLHKPDAAYLTQSGRCYLQVGNDELYELFQSGFSGAVYYDDEEDVSTDIATMLDVNGTSFIEGNHARTIRQKEKKMEWIGKLLEVTKEVYGDDSEKLKNAGREEKEHIAGLVLEKLLSLKYDYPDTEHNRENLITLFEYIGMQGFDTEKILDIEAQLTNAKKKLPQKPERTQLEAVVGYLKMLAKLNNYNHDFSLFLPLLPTLMGLDELPQDTLPRNSETIFGGTAWPDHEGKRDITVGLGLYDDPENQRQDLYTLSFPKAGSLMVIGAPATGKSSFLQTFVYELITRYSPAEVTIYALEFSVRKFTPFAAAPHIGGIVTENDSNEKLEKFFIMMGQILAERKQRLGETGYEHYVAETEADSMPAMFIIIDNFASLVNRAADRYNGILQQLVKEGATLGIFIIVSAAGCGSGEIPNNMAQNFKTTVCLELNNVFDYTTYMRTAHLRMRPEAGIPGRGIAKIGERVLEYQTALPLKSRNDAECSKVFNALSGKMKQAWEDGGEDRYYPRPIPEIPEEPVWEEFRKLHDVKHMFASNKLLPIGYDAKTAAIYGIDYSEVYSYLITGSKKKGKTNTLKVIACAAAAKGARVVIVDFDRTLAKFAQDLGVEAIHTEMDFAGFLSKLLVQDISVRNKFKSELVGQNLEEKEIFEKMQQFGQIFVLINNLPEFVTRVIKPTEQGVPNNLNINMEMIMSKGYLHNLYWFSTADKENLGVAPSYKLFKLFAADKKGIHFGGNAHSTAVAGMSYENQDRKTVDTAKPAGRGMLASDNGDTTLEVVLPMVKGNLK